MYRSGNNIRKSVSPMRRPVSPWSLLLVAIIIVILVAICAIGQVIVAKDTNNLHQTIMSNIQKSR